MNEQATLDRFSEIANRIQRTVLATYSASLARGIEDPTVMFLDLGDDNARMIGRVLDPRAIARLEHEVYRLRNTPTMIVGLTRREAIRLISDLTPIDGSSIDRLNLGGGYLLLIVDQGLVGMIKMSLTSRFSSESITPAASNASPTTSRENPPR